MFYHAVCAKYLSITLREVSAFLADQTYFQVRQPSHHHMNRFLDKNRGYATS